MATGYSGFSIRSGSYPSEPIGALSDAGSVVLAQTITLQAATAANVDGQFVLPANARIIEFNGDSTVAWTATTASLTIGKTAGGTDYVTGFDVKTVTRGPTAALTATQLANCDIGANTTVYVRVASTGANTTGTTRVTVRYAHLG
jgi:hypothetical protein